MISDENDSRIIDMCAGYGLHYNELFQRIKGFLSEADPLGDFNESVRRLLANGSIQSEYGWRRHRGGILETILIGFRSSDP